MYTHKHHTLHVMNEYKSRMQNTTHHKRTKKNALTMTVTFSF